MFQDEARFGRISRCRYCWAKSPLRPTVKAMLTHQSVHAYGAVSIPQGNFDSLVLPHVNSDCMAIFLAEIAKRYPDDNIVMVLDGAGWHKSKSMTIPDNIRLLGLPPYSPERNPVEHLWDELREKHFHNRAFDSLDALENQLVEALHPLENSDERVKSICNWEWIIKAIFNANYNKTSDGDTIGDVALRHHLSMEGGKRANPWIRKAIVKDSNMESHSSLRRYAGTWENVIWSSRL